jgi:uncharacterized protein with PIN domain
MDRTELMERMTRDAQQAVAALGREASGSRQDLAMMERQIYDTCDRLKATLLQTWVDQARDDSPRPVCPTCGGPMRQKERSNKTSACMGGQVTVARTRWWCDACKASFFPSG